MGLAEMLLGSQNPFAQFVAGNRNAIRGAGMGLASGPDFGQGLANAAMYANQGAAADDAYALTLKEKADREAQMQKSIDYLRSSNPKLAELVAAGMDPNQAFAQMLDEMQPAAPTKLEFRDVNGDVLGIDPYTGQSKVVYDGQPEKPAAPSGYRWTETGNLEFIPGGSADPVNKRGGGMPSATLQKEMFETDEGILAGENVIGALDRALELNASEMTRSGWGSELGATLGANLPDWVPGVGGNEALDANTLELKNLVTSQALDQLKATFGSMPTEGERKILIEIQGSVDQPREVREAIFKRARIAAEKRLKFNRKKAEALRSGKYFDEGFSPMSVDSTSTGDPELDQLLQEFGG